MATMGRGFTSVQGAGLILEARSMFTEEVMSDEDEGATLFPQGG